jgi:peptide-methionine (R)-S-oxide reductase
MTRQNAFAALGFVALAALGCAAVAVQGASSIKPTAHGPKRKDKVVMTDAEWNKKLSPKAFEILRREGTETPFSSPLNNIHVPGVFSCGGCGLPLYKTADKFDSGTGWPSFVKPITKDAVWYKEDGSLGEIRNEVLCARCDGHLGHVFDDGPKERGGLRYCMDGDALTFKPDVKKP